MRSQDFRCVAASGYCVAAVPQRAKRAEVERRPRVQPAAQGLEDAAPWVMRFLALTLVLFVLVLLVLHG